MVGVLTGRAESSGPTGRAHMDRTLDRQLIARLQARDETAVAELAERYGSRIYQLALRHMKNREDAEEVAQDVLMKVYRKVGAFRGDAALSSWIYRITFNTAMSRLRNSKLARLADQMLRSQLRQAVTRAILELPEIYRAPVVLRDIQGLTTEEASSRLRLKDQTLKSRLHRGRLMLRERLRAFTSGLTLHRPTPVYS
jgi:RNA polymerase sigma-70 factor (ECF subfamily)